MALFVAIIMSIELCGYLWVSFVRVMFSARIPQYFRRQKDCFLFSVTDDKYGRDENVRETMDIVYKSIVFKSP